MGFNSGFKGLKLTKYDLDSFVVLFSLTENLFRGSATALCGSGPPRCEASRSQSDSPRLVGLLWTSDQPDAGTSI